MKRSIEVVVSPSGEVLIEAIGFKGSDCETATRFLEEALGVCANRQRKPEYHQNARQQSTQSVGE